MIKTPDSVPPQFFEIVSHRMKCPFPRGLVDSLMRGVLSDLRHSVMFQVLLQLTDIFIAHLPQSCGQTGTSAPGASGNAASKSGTPSISSNASTLTNSGAERIAIKTFARLATMHPRSSRRQCLSHLVPFKRCARRGLAALRLIDPLMGPLRQLLRGEVAGVTRSWSSRYLWAANRIPSITWRK
jgi:hypothetical protein